MVALDYGPVGEADVTANLMEYAPCGPVRHKLAEAPHAPDALPFLRIKAAHHGAASDILAQVLSKAARSGHCLTPVLVSCPAAPGMSLCAGIVCSSASSHVWLAHVVA